jgi:hypothetical protein
MVGYLVYIHTGGLELLLHYYQPSSLSKQLAVAYSNNHNPGYRSMEFVFELFASSVLPQYVLVFCHIVTACGVL